VSMEEQKKWAPLRRQDVLLALVPNRVNLDLPDGHDAGRLRRALTSASASRFL
jgi:hypothetical protein